MQTGRLSDLAVQGHKADWSALNEKLKAIEPGETLSVTCPKGVAIAKFRSLILTNGRRFHRDGWAISTRTQGNVIHCFLSPRGAPCNPG